MASTYRNNADGSAVCPHRDLTCCAECVASDPALVDVAGAYFHVPDPHERLVLAVVADADPGLPIIRHDSEFPHQIECADPDCSIDYGADTPADLLACIAPVPPVRLDRPAPTITGHGHPVWRDGELVVATGFNSMKHSRDPEDAVPYERSVEQPAPTLHGNAGGAWTIGAPGHRQPPHAWKQRRNDQSGSGEVDPDWPLGRPATTLAGRDLVTDPGANANRFNGAKKSRNDGYRITIEEALVLQSCRPDLPVAGNRTQQFGQVGNMVPPRLAAHLAAAVLGIDPPTYTGPHPQPVREVVDTAPL